MKRLPLLPSLPAALLISASMLIGCASTPEPKPHTAGRGVTVLVTPFMIPVLNRQRNVRLYLPPSYGTSDKRYPVIYMHDGQNLFDEATSYAGEWGVDETLNEMAAQRGLEVIVVGVDNGGEHRRRELNPFDNPTYGAGEGEAYLSFIVDKLKPLIDRQYRTLTGPQDTAIIGSSMGGLISDYAIHRYPQVFSRAGVLSPAYATADPGIYNFAARQPLAAGTRVYFSMGGKEDEQAVPNVQRMHALAAAQRPEPGAVTLHIVPEAQHNEAAWRAELPKVLEFLFAPLPPAASASQPARTTP
ncbi:alpha/beta hydrolase-fold protein [Ideonella sp. DXS29W]|uniref:Alpha/beta hydrolase-fold protein n=1 Tax=Ideonella lacteola TaxID=2984193 RepID=A0ABU9BPP4_9BURK